MGDGRCPSESHGTRCQKHAGHDGYCLNVGTNGTQVWNIPLRSARRHV